MPFLREVALFFLDLLLPTRCVLCDGGERELCEQCFTHSSGAPRVEHLGDLKLCVSGANPEAVVSVLRRVKDHGQTRLCFHLARWMDPALSLMLTEAGITLDHVALVIPPSPARSWRHRGFHPTELTLRRTGARPLAVLRNARRRRDQRDLNAVERARNLLGAFIVSGSVAGVPVILVDDVVTTGSTLLEAKRALESAGALVLGAVALARVPLWRDTAN